MVSETAQVVITSVFSLLVITDIVGNSLVCVVLIKNQDMRTPMNFLLVNLALADIMVALFIAPQFILIHAFKHPDGMTGTLLCKLLTGGNLMWTGATASAFSLVVIAFERYYAVMYPYGNKRKLTTGKLKLIIPMIWITSVIINMPFFLTTYFSKEDNYCMEHWPGEWTAKAYSLAWFVLLGALPMIMLSALYSRIIYSLWIKQEVHHQGAQQAVLRVRKRVTKMVIAVSIIYVLCWTPDLVIYAMIHFSSKHNLGDAADIISIMLVTCNSTVNPFIYAYVNPRFRKQIKALLCCRSADRNRIHDIRRRSLGSMTANNVAAASIVEREVDAINKSGKALHSQEISTSL